MENIFATGLREPFDITDFEQLVGSLSHTIVIFPEAPGSFAETGYFSAIEELSKKTILVMDSGRQRDDSFISLGPAKKINQNSIFTPVIQMDYENPNFEIIISRIDNRAPLSTYLKLLTWKELSDLSDYEFFCLIFEIVNFLTIATFSDIEFMLRAMASSHLSVVRLQQLTSVLVGAGYLGPVDKVDSQISRSVIQDCFLGGSFGSRRPDRYGMADHRRVVAHRTRQEVPTVAR